MLFPQQGYLFLNQMYTLKLIYLFLPEVEFQLAENVHQLPYYLEELESSDLLCPQLVKMELGQHTFFDL